MSFSEVSAPDDEENGEDWDDGETAVYDGDCEKLVEQDVPKGDNGGRLDLVPREAAVLRVEASHVLFFPPVRHQFVLVVLEAALDVVVKPRQRRA